METGSDGYAANEADIGLKPFLVSLILVIGESLISDRSVYLFFFFG